TAVEPAVERRLEDSPEFSGDEIGDFGSGEGDEAGDIGSGDGDDSGDGDFGSGEGDEAGSGEESGSGEEDSGSGGADEGGSGDGDGEHGSGGEEDESYAVGFSFKTADECSAAFTATVCASVSSLSGLLPSQCDVSCGGDGRRRLRRLEEHAVLVTLQAGDESSATSLAAALTNALGETAAEAAAFLGVSAETGGLPSVSHPDAWDGSGEKTLRLSPGVYNFPAAKQKKIVFMYTIRIQLA
ncbi:hypothetical protein EMIHUDRAFT_236572, partial [Emiliania huxleyi CCMP1516]|uniref:Uncharacterized protein n=2 Tax=Emiliania huxleyi TaxID=2903 RepID=A0A0D3JTC6_EMIH1